MARIKGRGTGPELAVAAALRDLGLEWEEHAGDLPGRPDLVFRKARVAVFIDGDFWHGWRFDHWRDKLTEKWEAKILETRRRDQRNRRALRRAGWYVVRLWEHQIENGVATCTRRIVRLLDGLGTSEHPATTAVRGDEPRLGGTR
jgi:DNA mismatch endonuclease (patch repair protein)